MIVRCVADGLRNRCIFTATSWASVAACRLRPPAPPAVVAAAAAAQLAVTCLGRPSPTRSATNSSDCTSGHPPVLPLHAEQLFTCKLGGRKPTLSGKLPTHSRHFAKWINWLFNEKSILNISGCAETHTRQCRISTVFSRTTNGTPLQGRGKGTARVMTGEREGREKEKGKGKNNGDSPLTSFHLKRCTVCS